MPSNKQIASTMRWASVALFALMLGKMAHAETLTIAAASDLKFAMAEIIKPFQARHPNDRIEVIYGSSGKFMTLPVFRFPFLSPLPLLIRHELTMNPVRPEPRRRAVLRQAQHERHRG